MSHLEKARSAWGSDLPDWVDALATAADTSSQNAMARVTGYSAATLSGAIGKTYEGNLSAVEERVRATVMAEMIVCPEIGDTSLTQCFEWREQAVKPFRSISSLHIMMRRACKACPRNGGKDAQ